MKIAAISDIHGQSARARRGAGRIGRATGGRIVNLVDILQAPLWGPSTAEGMMPVRAADRSPATTSAQVLTLPASAWVRPMRTRRRVAAAAPRLA